MNSLISVVVPVFNGESYLEETLASLQKQSYSNFEVIIIDDGSTDNTSFLVSSFLSDSRFRYRRIENSGVSHARLVGLSLAVGQFVFFLDSDDVLTEDAFTILISNIADGVDILVAQYAIFDKNKLIQHRFNQAILCSRNYSTSSILSGEVYCALWGKLYRRNVLELSDFFVPKEFSVGEDYLISSRLACKNMPCRYINDIIYLYRQRKSSLTSKKFLSIDYYNRFRDLLEADLLSNGFSGNFREDRMRGYIGLVTISFVKYASLSDFKILFNNIYRYNKFSDCKCYLDKVVLLAANINRISPFFSRIFIKIIFILLLFYKNNRNFE